MKKKVKEECDMCGAIDDGGRHSFGGFDDGIIVCTRCKEKRNGDLIWKSLKVGIIIVIFVFFVY